MPERTRKFLLELLWPVCKILNSLKLSLPTKPVTGKEETANGPFKEASLVCRLMVFQLSPSVEPCKSHVLRASARKKPMKSQIKHD